VDPHPGRLDYHAASIRGPIGISPPRLIEEVGRDLSRKNLRERSLARWQR
jgi:hypothetical protein